MEAEGTGVIEATRIDQHIWTALDGDPSLSGLVSGVWADVIPDGEPLPAVVFSMSSALDVTTVDGNRVLVTGDWTVKAIGESDSYVGTLEYAADRIDTVLSGLAGQTIDGVTVARIVRAVTVRYLDDDAPGGKVFRHLGGVYRAHAYTA